MVSRKGMEEELGSYRKQHDHSTFGHLDSYMHVPSAAYTY